MDVIQGTARPKSRRRWWRPRPHLRLVGEPETRRQKRAEDDAWVAAMVGSLCLSLVFFAIVVGNRVLE